jgi:8-oxo-dGTP pyrophosphatase MutT (NUDIX family)
MATRLHDGDGWTRCQAGHQHWGRHGAAGLLLQSTGESGQVHVLLQRRAWWTHHGDTWGVPGGARASWETPEQAALRELGEEVELSLDAGPDALSIVRVHHDDHGGWSYWTVIASTGRLLVADTRGQESAEIRWVPAAEVAQMALHPGFAASWSSISPT